ncbi:MAG: XamI family restriction endonuclease [Nitrospirota bacterium]
MPMNSDKTHLWKSDVAQSIDFYNNWFLRFAPVAYRKQRILRTNDPLLSDLKKKQFASLKRWFLRRGYKEMASDEVSNLDAMPPGTFSSPHTPSAANKQTLVKTSLDCLVMPIRTSKRVKPLVIEIKSSGNATTSLIWRRKEVEKFEKLKERYGNNVEFILLFCGLFDPGYLGFVAAEGIDWVWEHRLNDLRALVGWRQ